MTNSTLQDVLAGSPSVGTTLQNSTGGKFNFPIQPQFSNWIDEQMAWRTSAVLQDMSFHMTILHITGPELIDFITSLGVNSFSTFAPMQAKQLVLCNAEGLFVGDAILVLEDDVMSVIGRPEGVDWVHFHAQTSSFDVSVIAVERPAPTLAERRTFRYQVQGPNAEKILETVNGGSLPDIAFFKMGNFDVGPYRVTALNHRMSGAPGYEIWGPSENGAAVKALLVEAGKPYGLRMLGGRVYQTTAAESGWLGGPVSAIYTSPSTQDYREWLSSDSYQATASLGGSHPVNPIEDLYVTPWDLGYGFMVKFDHDFVGRPALEELQIQPHRQKVRLLWNADDIVDINRSMLGDGDRYKYMEVPAAGYATYHFDEVMFDGERVGMSNFPVYSANTNGWFSLAMIDTVHAIRNRELVLTWGEPDGGSAKPGVERHVQKTVRVAVDPEPMKRST